MLRYAPLCIRLVRKCVGLMHTNDGRYWIRTSDPFRVKEVRYHCANRPRQPLYKLRFQLDYELRLGLNR